MAKTARQTAIFGVEDWKRLYQTFREADFQSYDFETLRKSFIDYLRLYYPETFNDYIESSEFIALLDVMAFMGQALAFRNDLNARENFLDTAERRDSVVRLANLVGYTPKRNAPGEGLLKVFSVSTTENIVDFNGINLQNVTVDWNDPTNSNWQEQTTLIVNAALVNSQRFGRPANSQTIQGIKTDEYTVNLVPGFLPVLPYNSTVDGISMPFEAVSSTTIDSDRIYEPSPRPTGAFNILYRNDQLGFGSDNTGFFVLFKQGSLQNQDFNLAEAIENRTVDINIQGVNDQDYWLYKIDSNGSIQEEWQSVENIFTAAAEQTLADKRKIYSVTSRANDQITLVFGDGVFSEIPVGLFRSYVRASNGLQYIINPEEMQAVPITISYISRIGRVETITFTCGITQPISNAQARETIDQIKQRAPARFYTQNRMVNGEDYNNFPFTLYNSIIKSKAVARSSTGSSRYIDLTDVTGKYSSTNSYASDGVIYQTDQLQAFEFEWLDRNDIVNVIVNRLEPLLADRAMTQFYNANFARPDLGILNIQWNQSTTQINETTGYFYLGAPTAPQTIGSYSSSNTRFITQGSLVKFEPPVGYYFDTNNRLLAGSPQRAGDKTVIWSTVSKVLLDGTNQGLGNLSDGLGPVALNDFVPTEARATQVISRFVTDLPSSVEQAILQQIELYRDFGIGYNNNTASWYIITSTNLASGDAFNVANAESTQNLNLDASWLVKFTTDGQLYTVAARALNYVFASVIENRFVFDVKTKIYDVKTGSTVTDFVRVLKSNSRPDANEALPSDVSMEVIAQPVQSDGFVNDYEVIVSYRDSDNDGVADDPDFFDTLVAPNIGRPLIFLQRTIDFDNLERYLPTEPGVVDSSFPTLASIDLVKAEFVNGQVFYAYTDKIFYQLAVGLVNGVITRRLSVTQDFIARVGRQSLSFQYRHNSPLTNIINPGVTNIIDLYVVTQQYYTQYQNYINDSTGTVKEPAPETIGQLTSSYSKLNEFKMISDNIVLNSVVFKPLFGLKAAPELQATIKVVRAQNSTASDSEIKSQVVANINEYFTIDKWDFGDNFFFSELAAYLHERLGSIISSVVLVPVDPSKYFGDLYEIRSAPNEIFVSAATVNDIEVITALTQSNIRSQGPVSGLYALTDTGRIGSASQTSI